MKIGEPMLSQMAGSSGLSELGAWLASGFSRLSCNIFLGVSISWTWVAKYKWQEARCVHAHVHTPACVNTHTHVYVLWTYVRMHIHSLANMMQKFNMPIKGPYIIVIAWWLKIHGAVPAGLSEISPNFTKDSSYVSREWDSVWSYKSLPHPAKYHILFDTIKKSRHRTL